MLQFQQSILGGLFFSRALHKGSLIKYDLLQFFYLSSFCIFIEVHIYHILSILEEVFHQIGTKRGTKDLEMETYCTDFRL